MGIAYQATPKTVIRVGYGRGYDLGIFGSVFGHNVTQNLPVLGIQTLSPANNFDTVFTLAQGPTPFSPADALAGQPKGPNGFPILPNGVTPFIISKDMRLANCGRLELHNSTATERFVFARSSLRGKQRHACLRGNGGRL